VPKWLLCAVLAALPAVSVFAEDASVKALIDKALADNASGAQTVSATLASLEQAVLASAAPSDTRSLYIFIGSLQEQRGLYTEASRSYAVAAGISAENASGMPQVSAEQLTINAVRCALSAGEYETAEAYLDSVVVRQATDPLIAVYAKLYAVWCLIVKTDGGQRMKEAVELLKQYAVQSDMEPVFPAVLLMLWRIAGDTESGETLVARYPHSPEAAIVSGKAELLATPFWCFFLDHAPPPDTVSAQPE
jgi:hypothetical protein